ncbi:MAG: universal stress protein [Bacteroidales bacterium]|jgi:nucleotide-binding universal stress UspA family protein|nr:universal stress protein [Bacteroidales bacterium]
MEKEKDIIVVPWDFTKKAENALAHAAKISKTVNAEISLLHIVDRNVKTGEYKKKESRLIKIAEDGKQIYNVDIKTAMVPGSIFSAIAEFVNEVGATLVVMGTHGIKGMQKLTGSWALKVLVKSKVPFIVVQDEPKDMEKYQNIVFPVDFRSENKEKLKMTIFMGKYFESKVHILKTVTTDKSLLKKTNINLNFAIKYLIQNNIDYEIHDMKRGNLAKQTIEFAESVNADLILIMTTKNITLADYMLGAQEQQIIANSSKIPVCCVNPRASFASKAQFMYG